MTAVAIVRLGALHHFAWRLDVVLALLSGLWGLLLNGSLWGAVASGSEGVASLPADRWVTYVVVAWAVSRVTTSSLDGNLSQRIASGQVAMDLLKPVSLLHYLWWRDVGRAATVTLVTALPLFAVGVAVFSVSPPVSSVALGWAVLATGVGMVIGAHVAMCIGITAVWWRRADGLIQLKDVGVALLSGALVPIPLMPGWAGDVAVWLPTAGLAHVPAGLYTGAMAIGQAPWVCAYHLGWAVVLVALSRWMWARALDQLTVEGG